MNSRIPGPDPEPGPAPRSGLATFGKVLLWLVAIGAVLIVLVFGTCLLMFARH